MKDQYWDEILTTELPYTAGTVNNREQPPEASTANIEVRPDKAEIIPVVQSNAKMDDMVRKNSVNYEFPDNNDGEKVRRTHKAVFSLSVQWDIIRTKLSTVVDLGLKLF